MKNIKNWNWNKIGWITFIVCLFIAFNTATIFYFVANWIPYISNGNEYSYYDLICTKFVAKEVAQQTGLDFHTWYSWWHKPLIILSMIVGWALSGWLSYKLISKSKSKREEMEVAKEQDKKFEKLADKIMKGVK